MVQALERRGPDGHAVVVRPGATLGHRRLSIFDLSAAGAQPMSSASGRTWVTFNGAIYNFPALRRELETAGRTFRSETDTEVLVEGYEQWGIDELVRRLRGMFAFGIWDEAESRLYLVRDRLGVKPLVYQETDRGLAFASTGRALRRAGVGTGFNDQAVLDYLHFGYIPERSSVFAGLHKLPPATILEWSSELGVRTRRYWDLKLGPPFTKIGFEEALEETRRLFLDAVQVRLKADVPVGALLSGGIDSALLCWGVREAGADVACYTVGVEDDVHDETSLARRTAQALGLEHHVLPLQPADQSDLREWSTAYAEPLGAGSTLGMLAISRTVREQATVLLTGDGGDDIFLGYPRHEHLWRAQRLAQFTPPGTSAVWRALRGGLPQRLSRAKHFGDYVAGGVPAFLSANPGLTWLHGRGLLGPALRGLRIAELDEAWTRRGARSALYQYLPYHLSTQFVSEYLTKVDGATMHHGLEARSPLLDQHLWEFASRLPVDVRMHRGNPKALLRELVGRNVHVGASQERKRGFVIPVERWLVGPWQSLVQDYFASPVVEALGFIDGAALRAEYARAQAKGTGTLHLWFIFALEHWLRHETGS